MNLTPEVVYPLASAILFAGFAAVTLGGALVAVGARRLVRCVSGLALSFTGLAGLYFYLNSPFLALMQILIYVGAVCITIMFAMMLADPHDDPPTRGRDVLWIAGSALLAALLAAGLLLLLARAEWMPAAVQTNTDTVQDLGRALLARFGFAFELISVVLLLAILGALVVARSGRKGPS